MQEYIGRVFVGAVVVIASGLVLGVGLASALLADTSNSLVTLRSNDHSANLNGFLRDEGLDSPAETASLTSVAKPGAAKAAEQARPARTGAIARKSEVDLQRDPELAAEVERLKQENAAIRQARAAAEARLSEQTRAHREDRELMAVIQQELFRALDEIERLKKHSTALAEKAAAREHETALAEKAAARERERAAALRRELHVSQRQVQQLRAGLAKQAQTDSQARGADKIQSGSSMSSQPEDRARVDQ